MHKIGMNKQTVKELKSLAKEHGIKGYYRTKKAELIAASGITQQSKIMVDESPSKRYNCIHGKQKYIMWR